MLTCKYSIYVLQVSISMTEKAATTLSINQDDYFQNKKKKKNIFKSLS